MKKFSLFKSALWITYANLVTRIFVFISQLVLARLLEPSDFGIIAIVYVFWSFFTLFTQGTSGAYILYKGIDDAKHVNTSYTLSLLAGVILTIGMALSASFVAAFFNEPVLRWILVAFSINLLLSSLTYAQVGVLTRKMEYKTLANISLANSMVRLLFTIGSALLGFRYWSFVIGDVASWVAYFVLTYKFSSYKYRLQIHPEARSEVLSFWSGTMGSSIGQYANFNLDNFTVAKILGSTSLGFYNLAYQITMAFSTILNPILDQLGMPVFSQLSNDIEQRKALLKVLECIALISAPIYSLLFLFINPQVISALFGEKWLSIYALMPGLLTLAYFRVINLPLNAMLTAKGRPDINAKVNLSIAPVAILSFILGASHFGIVGVSLAVALVLGIVWTLYWWLEGCRQLKWEVGDFFKAIITPILLSLPGLLLACKLPFSLGFFVFLTAYLATSRIFAPKSYMLYESLARKIAYQLAK